MSLVFVAVLFMTPYPRLRKLPASARTVLAVSKDPSAEGQWSRRLGSHPLAGLTLLLVFAVMLGALGYLSDSDRSSNGSESTEFSSRDLLQPVSTPPEKADILRSSAGGFSLRVPTGWTAIDFTSPDVGSELTRLHRDDPLTYAIVTGLARANSRVSMVLVSGLDDTTSLDMTTALVRSWPFTGTLSEAETFVRGDTSGRTRYVELPVGGAFDTITAAQSSDLSGTQEDYVFLAGGDAWDFTFYLFGAATPPKHDAGAAAIVRTFSASTASR